MRFLIIGKGSVNADVFIEFLKRLIKSAEPEISFIVDRCSAHCAKKVIAFVQPLGSKLRLFFSPPYLPDRSPDELVRLRASLFSLRGAQSGWNQILVLGSVWVQI